MRVSSVLVSALCVVFAAASPSWMPGQVSLNQDYKVPGDNPLHYCGDPAEDLLTIEKVDLSPNPPLPYVFPIDRLCLYRAMALSWWNLC